MPPVLQFENVTKEYRKFFGKSVRALDGFSLTVEAGEIFGFLGPNGAGKTTAIHLAMGFMRASHGAGSMLGKPFGDPGTRRRVGFLAENVAFYHMPARRLVRFYGALNGMRDPALSRRTREMLELVELSSDSNRNVSKFSRGMLQRVGLAQALVNDPELLVLDEPTSALDPAGRVAVRELLAEARKAGKTIFLSSHMLSEIEALCDRVGILHRGRLIRLGKTAELLESRSQMEVVARGVDASQFGGRAEEDGIHLVVPVSALRPTVERLWNEGGEIVRVNPLRRSLEDIFLELTSDEAPQPNEQAEGTA